MKQKQLEDERSRIKAFPDTIEPGWFDGVTGEVPTTDSVRVSVEIIEQIHREHPYHPRIFSYPTPSGGVTLEWSIGNWEASIEVSSDGSSEGSAICCRGTGSEGIVSAEIERFVEMVLESGRHP